MVHICEKGHQSAFNRLLVKGYFFSKQRMTVLSKQNSGRVEL